MPLAFMRLGKRALNQDPDPGHNFNKQYRWFRAHFGLSPSSCSILWKKLVDYETLPPGRKPVHLLWALSFLYRYPTEEVAASSFGVHEDTFRKWSSLLVESIAQIKPAVVR